MVAIKATYDGKNVIIPGHPVNLRPGSVIVIFENTEAGLHETGDWLKAQEAKFSSAWDNEEDSVYDRL